jgi:hypothetical protein
MFKHLTLARLVNATHCAFIFILTSGQKSLAAIWNSAQALARTVPVKYV